MAHRDNLLRILAAIDQTNAMVEEVIEDDELTDEEFDRIVDVVAELRDSEIWVHAALKQAAN